MSNFNVSYNAGGTVDKIKEVENIDNLNNVSNVSIVQEVNKIGAIQGFAKKTQPFNKMFMINVPAGVEVIEEEFILPNEEIEILALTVTCSGYGEDDKFDLYFNEVKWFDSWYCSEIKEGLFLGTSTYVYVAPASSKIKINFYNSSLTSKRVWLGVRMLKDFKDNERK